MALWIAGAVLAASVAGCSEKTVEDGLLGDTIALRATLGGASSSDATKASMQATIYSGTTPTENAPLVADIWFSTTSGTYPGNTQGAKGTSFDGTVIDSHRTIEYINGKPTTPSGVDGSYLRYPYDDATVYCVGFHPSNEVWTTTDGLNATASISGEDDLMFAPEIQGKRTAIFSSVSQNYSHLLSLLKFRVRAEGVETSETWGKLQKISIYAKDRVNVKLDDGTVSFANSAAQDAEYVLFSGSTDITTTSAELGSALLAPVIADGSTGAEYVMHIECANHTKDININLLDENGAAYSGSTAGHVFVVTLCFYTLSYVEGSANLSKWEEEYKDLVLN